MKNFKFKYVLVMSIIVILLIISISFFNINIAENQDYQNVVNNSIILKLGTNKMLVNDKVVLLDDQNPRTMPYLDENDRTLVPIRCISENLKYSVVWDDQNQTATISNNDSTIIFTINSKQVKKDNIEKEMDTEAIIYEDRTYIPLRALMEIGFNKEVYWDNDTQLIIISNSNNNIEEYLNTIVKQSLLQKLDSLSTVNNYETFEKLIDTSDSFYDNVVTEAAGQFDSMNSLDESKTETGASSDRESSYSTTNTQVQGVDESDIIKTNGRYIYYLSYNKLVIVDAKDPNNIKTIKEVNFVENEFNPVEMFLDDTTLTIIGQEIIYNEKDPSISTSNSIYYDMYYRPREAYTKTICYDITNPNNIIEKRNIKTEGYYIDSRKIEDDVYVISSKYIYTLREDAQNKPEQYKPKYVDSVISSEKLAIDYSDIMYFPEIDTNSYTIISSFNTNNLLKANISTYLGASENIYMSTDSLYVSQSDYEYDENSSKHNTIIYKFDIKNGSFEYNSKCKIEGNLLNQFSMDEYNGYFRVAITKNEYNNKTWETRRSNEIHVLDENMKAVGKIENMAEGETIYSVRFMGDKGYVVTYRQVDPLFVLDLSVPTNPKILGELKIEGYSSYLHPYDENHIIGFGIDTKQIDEDSVEQYGVKMAIFDVTDPTNPIEMFKENVGDYGTYSDLLNNHKALLFSKEKNLLAFPITIYKENGSSNKYNSTEISDIGLIVYNIDLINGFKQKGVITHLGDINDIDGLSYSNYSSKIYNYIYNLTINRALYIDDNIYTASNAMIKCNSINDLSELSKIDIQVPENKGDIYYIN